MGASVFLYPDQEPKGVRKPGPRPGDMALGAGQLLRKMLSISRAEDVRLR